MAERYVALSDPLATEEIRSCSRRIGKHLALLSAIIGFGCAALCTAAVNKDNQVSPMEPIISMASAPQLMHQTRIRPVMQQSSNRHLMQPFHSREVVLPGRRFVGPFASSSEEEVYIPDAKQKPMFELMPIYPRLETVQGGGTIRTYKLPIWADRVQYYLETEGRPLKATVNLWIGPIRQTHNLKCDVENGRKTPIFGTLKFKKDLGPVLKLSTGTSADFPVKFGVYVPTKERSKEIHKYTENVFDASSLTEKQKIQGGHTEGGGGAIRYWTIPSNVASVQLIGWTKDVGKKSFRTEIEVLQGPNRVEQNYALQCGGSCQPYHAIIQTPGEGCVIRIKNKKFVEDGLLQIAILPYEMVDDGTGDGGDGSGFLISSSG